MLKDQAGLEFLGSNDSQVSVFGIAELQVHATPHMAIYS
jgi:hypothetical protein